MARDSGQRWVYQLEEMSKQVRDVRFLAREPTSSGKISHALARSSCRLVRPVSPARLRLFTRVKLTLRVLSEPRAFRHRKSANSTGSDQPNNLLVWVNVLNLSATSHHTDA